MVRTFLKVVATIVGILIIVVALPVWIVTGSTVLAVSMIAIGLFMALLGV